MSDTKELKKIKKIYGEGFKNLCRELFPNILEQEGELLKILEQSFSHNCNSLYEAITDNGLETDFKELIYSKFDEKREKNEEQETRTPYEILKEAGYNLYECQTEEDIQGFRKYYEENEVLCTIYNGGRLNRCFCFWAVKENVDEIKRKDFENPKKDDEYSTSVLAIQFSKGRMCTVQMISRYNHTVTNPNCTLGNDLNKLVPGLEQSFANLMKERGLELNSTNKEEFSIPGYTVANDGKYYKYNMEINGNYYCPGNIVIKAGGEAVSVASPEEGLLVDYFYIDKKNKTIEACANIKDAFVDDLKDIKRIEVVKATEEEQAHRIIRIYKGDEEEPVVIGINKDNEIVTYQNNHLAQVGDSFLYYNKCVCKLTLSRLKSAGKDFLYGNNRITELELPNLEQVEWNFLYSNEEIASIKLPNLRQVEFNFLYNGRGLKKLNLPELIQTESNFLYNNRELEELNLPKLIQTKNNFLMNNRNLTILQAPKLKTVGDNFLFFNEGLSQLELLNLEGMGDNCFWRNEMLDKVYLPKLENMGANCFMRYRGLNGVYSQNISNLKKCFQKYTNPEKRITPQDICKLDITNQTTHTDVKRGAEILQEPKDNSRQELPIGKGE